MASSRRAVAPQAVVVLAGMMLAGMMLAACGGTSPANEPAPSGVVAGDPARARSAFASYVAKLLNVQLSEIRGGPSDDTLGNHTRGAARHYTMWPVRDPASSIRGWVTPDGTVITPDRNLGVLLLEAGVWAKPPTRPLDELAGLLAGDIIWAYGSQGAYVEQAALVEGVTPPEITLRPDGSGTFRFFSNDHGGASIVGGGGAPADVYWENVAALTADHKATLSKRELGAARK